MSDNFESSLINLGELSKPATVLVEKISDAVGGIFKPYQIVRVAKAEAQADRVRAEVQIEISDLQRRAFHRFLEEEAKKQKNIEDITQKALPLLNENSKPNEVEDDWITHFFDRCRLISEEQMQTLWSRILAGEANSPGTYSKRTLSILSDLEQYDASLFKQLCSFRLEIPEYSKPVPVVYESDDFYKHLGINTETLDHLESIGLIKHTSSEYHRLHFFSQSSSTYSWIRYFDERILLRATDDRKDLPLGHVMLTKAGEEIASICASEAEEGFIRYLIDVWISNGIIQDYERDWYQG